MFIALAHWAEHLSQAYQIYVLGWPRPQAGGFLGLFFPWLVNIELMHYGYEIGDAGWSLDTQERLYWNLT